MKRRSRYPAPSRQRLAWLVALVGALQTFFQAADAAFRGEEVSVALWTLASARIGGAMLSVKNYTLRRRKYE